MDEGLGLGLNAKLIILNRPDLGLFMIEAWIFISFGLETGFLVGRYIIDYA